MNIWNIKQLNLFKNWQTSKKQQKKRNNAVLALAHDLIQGCNKTISYLTYPLVNHKDDSKVQLTTT